MLKRHSRESTVVVLVLAAAIAVATVLGSIFIGITHDFPTIPEPDRVAFVWKHDATAFRQRTPLSLVEFHRLS